MKSFPYVAGFAVLVWLGFKADAMFGVWGPVLLAGVITAVASSSKRWV